MTDPAAILQAVITDWSRDNRLWPVSVGEAETALGALLARCEAAEVAQQDVPAEPKPLPADYWESAK